MCWGTQKHFYTFGVENELKHQPVESGDSKALELNELREILT